MASAADYLEDPLFSHTRYRKIKDLNEGTFGIVLLALDIRSNEQVIAFPSLLQIFYSWNPPGRQHTSAFSPVVNKGENEMHCNRLVAGCFVRRTQSWQIAASREIQTLIMLQAPSAYAHAASKQLFCDVRWPSSSWSEELG